MSVSVSQISIDRSLDRSIDQSRLPGQSLDQFICVCRCLYKEQHPPNTRSHFHREILHSTDLFFFLSFSLSSSPTLDPLARPISTHIHDDKVAKSLSFPAITRREKIAIHAKITRLVLLSMRARNACGRIHVWMTRRRELAGDSRRRCVESRDRKEYCVCGGTRQGENAKGDGTRGGGRCTDDRAGFLERS